MTASFPSLANQPDPEVEYRRAIHDADTAARTSGVRHAVVSRNGRQFFAVPFALVATTFTPPAYRHLYSTR